MTRNYYRGRSNYGRSRYSSSSSRENLPQVSFETNKKGKKQRVTRFGNKLSSIECLYYTGVKDSDKGYFCIQGYRIKGRQMVSYTIFPVHKDGGTVRTCDVSHRFGAKSGQVSECVLCSIEARITLTGMVQKSLGYKLDNGNIYCPELKTTFDVNGCRIIVSK